MTDFKDDKPRRPRKAGAETWDPRGPRPPSDSKMPYAGKKTAGPGAKRSFDSVKAAAPGRGERPMFSKRPGTKPAAPKTPPKDPSEDARIAKVMARAGLCSRRDAEGWIAQGRVMVNGVVLASPAFNVTASDKIVVDGKPLGGRERTRLFLFHKPRGLVTTDRDPEGRPTIFTALPPELPRLMTIGRLDINTEGLLLMTNDGGLARVLELPKTGWMRRYRVRANGETDQGVLDGLREGVTIDGMDYQGIDAWLDRQQGANVWLTMGLREGKNREIKRVLEHIGLYVNRLIRLSFGPFQLGELGEGAVEEVPTRILQDQLGKALAAEAECDFDAEITAPLMSPMQRQAWQAEIEETARRDAQAKLREHTRHGAGREAAEGTRLERIKPGPRRHVSALRDERGEGARKGPRQRIETEETADRKGRKVAVERKTAVPGQAARKTRNADRFELEKRRTLRTDASTFGERRVRPPAEEERPRPSGSKFGERKFGEGRPAREKYGERKPGARPFAARAEGDRPARPPRAGGKPFGERASAARGDRPARSGKSYEGRSSEGRAERPARAGGKAFGERKFDGPRGEGRPSGPPRGAGRPAGGKPFGSKPGGGPRKPRG